MIEPGYRAPEFTLRSADGDRVALADSLRAGHHVLLIFLRHLG